MDFSESVFNKMIELATRVALLEERVCCVEKQNVEVSIDTENIVYQVVEVITSRFEEKTMGELHKAMANITGGLEDFGAPFSGQSLNTSEDDEEQASVSL